MTKDKYRTIPGDPSVNGVSRHLSGTQFTFSVRQGDAELYLYKGKAQEPFMIVPLPECERTGSVSSVIIDLPEKDVYTYLYKTDKGFQTDPYALEICPVKTGETIQERGVLKQFPEAETKPAAIPYEDMVFYKLHVRGFTMNRTGAVRSPGTFEALKEMIPYMKDLGINAVILMPVYEFRSAGKNYWGYTPGRYFAPKYSYSASGDPNSEFAALVDALHRAGMACFPEFMFVEQEDARLVTDVLRSWMMRFHVDGFHLVGDGPWLSAVRSDPLLSRTRLLLPHASEESLQDMRKPEKRIAVYNSSWRDSMRRFLKGDLDISAEETAWMLRRNGVTIADIQYFADQDGFTMADMVSYEERHNEANGEENRDGCLYNHTWNGGEEGPSRRQTIRSLRAKQLRNAMMLLFTAQGCPLLYAGDEMLNTQNGNNNAWCQDNRTGWTDWSRAKASADLHDFVKEALAFRKAHPVLHRAEPLRMIDYRACGLPDLSFHSHAAWIMESAQIKAGLGVLYCGEYCVKEDGSPDDTLYIVYNMYWQEQRFALPEAPKCMRWYLKADTSLDQVFFADGEEPAVDPGENRDVPAGPRSVRILIAR